MAAEKRLANGLKKPVWNRRLLRQGIAEDTGFSRHSGFCQYPLWRFKEEFPKGIGGENYQEYLRRYDEYMGIGRADRRQDQGLSMQ